MPGSRPELAGKSRAQAGPHGRRCPRGETHYFFESGAGCTIAFFEYAGFEPGFSAKPAGVPHPSASQFDRLALGLADDWVRRP
ncbi:MAG: hypothetical protein SGJ13_17655 [Actinomycetota bacterium]|nr:hypothetical protein [Actinomycetota bacterium]